MTNNDILRRIRFNFDIDDQSMIKIFKSAEYDVTRSKISNWLKKDTDDYYKSMSDVEFASFLNGFINTKRGKKEGPQPKPEERLNNNIILRKLKIALNLKDEDILGMLESVEFPISKHELSAFFRKPDNMKFRVCKDQIMRNFLHGMQLKYRDNK